MRNTNQRSVRVGVRVGGRVGWEGGVELFKGCKLQAGKVHLHLEQRNYRL